MELKGMAQIQMMNNFTVQSQSSLCLLYYPLIGKNAYALYEILNSFQNTSIDQEILMSISKLNEGQFETARMILEEFGLCKTYFDANQRIWLYALYAPLDANVFLIHETFGRLYMNEMGSKQYDFMKLHFSSNKDIPSSFIDISKPLDVDRLQKWNNDKENVYTQLKPSKESINFDWDTFFKGMDRIFPLRLRTDEHLQLIARLANIHGINAKDMKKYVQRSINTKTMIFDVEKLKKQVMYIRPAIQTTTDPYKMAPVQFMASKQNGAPVSIADKKIIENLCTQYPFSNEVVNVLIEYVLNSTKQQFNKAYVEKVAANWARLKIDTKEKALAQCKKNGTSKSTGSDLPEWYSDTESKPVDEKTLQEILELQKQLKGDNS